jgi:hypothetical protein
MAWLLTGVGLAIVAGDLSLLAVSWRSRSVLAGVLALAGVALVCFAAVSGPTREPGTGAIAVAGITLAIGAGLYWLGRIVQRLLDEEPDEPA